MLTVAQAVIKCLEKENIETVFGLPGAAICPIYDALFKSKIKHILVRHEQNAGHAANGMARITNRAQVCMATSGPGALNLITAIATAYMDSIPLVIITGQVSSDLLGRDVFQEADITGAVEPFCKHSFLVSDKNQIAITMKSAFHIAQTGRQGPVLIDIPVDIQQAEIEFSYPDTIDLRSYKPNLLGHIGQIKKVVTALNTAKKPLLCIGGGVFSSNAVDEVILLSNNHNIPIVSTMMGFSAVSCSNKNFLGMIGMYGKDCANHAMNEADLVLLVGARVGDRAVMSPIGLSKTATIVHIDIDAAEIGKNIKTDIPLVGDAKNILGQINSYLTQKHDYAWGAISALPTQNNGYCAKTFFNEFYKQVDDNAIIIADVGQNQIFAVREFNVKNGRFMTNGGMGTMGYAIGAGIGVLTANNSRQTVAICGDGAFQMAMCELATIAENDIPLKIIIVNNNCLGLVKEQQDNDFSHNEIAVNFTHNPNLDSIAKAYNIDYAKICCEQDFCNIEKMLNAKSAFLLEVVLPYETTNGGNFKL